MPANVTIYTRQWCGYCTAAERLLKDKRVAFEKIDCTGDDEKRQWLAEATGRSTVPQIFIDGRAIGGYDDMRALDRRGELDKLLAGSSEPPASPG
jgi:glutaredoxin 3